MNKTDKDFNKSLIFLCILGIFFILSSLIFNKYGDELNSLLNNDTLGMLIYFLLNIMEVVIAPINLLPLIVFASNIWGIFATVVLTVFAWTLGAAISFGLARRFGEGLVKKFVSVKKLHKFQKNIPEHHIFISIILMRALLPVDLLSYALGLFSKIKFRTFINASLIGFIPIALIFAYLGTLPVLYQIIGFVSIGFLLSLRYFIISRRS